jgi:hypothetical protein
VPNTKEIVELMQHVSSLSSRKKRTSKRNQYMHINAEPGSMNAKPAHRWPFQLFLLKEKVCRES